MATASEMGRKGGQAKSEAKAAAARKNASKPRGQWATAIAYEFEGVTDEQASPVVRFGCLLVPGKGPRGHLQFHDWVAEHVRADAGNSEFTKIEFLQLSTVGRLL